MYWRLIITLYQKNNVDNQFQCNKFNPSVHKLMFLTFCQIDNLWVKMLPNNNTWISFGNKCDNLEKKLKVFTLSLKFKRFLEDGLSEKKLRLVNSKLK